MENDLISVIVPVYKVEKYLNKCVQSIVDQTYINLEIILVDDGSPDNCPQMCDEWAKKDSRIKVIHKENGGLSDARNFGINNAKGEYLVFVDSDDFIEFNMIELLYTQLIKDNSDLAACNFNVLNEEYCLLSKVNIINDTESSLKTGIQVIEDIYAIPNYFQVVAWNKIYKANLFDDLRYPIGKIHEDEFLIHHILYKCHKVSIIQDYLYNYINRTDSIMNTKDRYQKFDSVECLIDRMNFFIEKDIKKGYNPLFLRLISICSSCYCNMQNFEYKKEMLKKTNITIKKFYYEIKLFLTFKTKLKYWIFKISPSLICFISHNIRKK